MQHPHEEQYAGRLKLPERIDLHIHLPNQLSGIGELKGLLVDIARSIISFKEIIMAALDDLTAKVEANNAVDESAIILLTGLKAKLDEAIASNDPAKLQQLSDALGASNQRLADAVTANTPAE